MPAVAPARTALPHGFVPGVLRANRLFESRDLDDTRDRISRVMQPHEVRAGPAAVRRAAGHMDFLRIGGLGLASIDFGEAVRIDVGPLAGYDLLMFCLQGHADTRADGRAVRAGATTGVACGAGRSFEADLSADCEQFLLRMDRDMVEAHCGRALRWDAELDLSQPALAAWLAQLQLIAGNPALAEAAQANPLVATEIERLMVHLLMAGQPWQDEDAPAISSLDTMRRGPAAGCVFRAEQFIQAHAADPIRLADVAEAAGVPARTLLDAFKRFRDASPMQHLRDVRLERVRGRLLTADEGAQVAGIALDCGFVHLGRFAQAYRERFGESPSATLARR